MVDSLLFCRNVKREAVYPHLSPFLELENPALLILSSKPERFLLPFCVTGNCHDPICYTLWFILKTLNLAFHALDLRDLKRMFYKLKTEQKPVLSHMAGFCNWFVDPGLFALQSFPALWGQLSGLGEGGGTCL